MASLVPSPFLAASKSEHQLSSLSQKHFFLHSFIPKRTQIAISSKSSIKVKCAAIGNGLLIQTSPEVRRVVPDNTDGLPTVKIVYVVLEAQYQSSLTAAVQALNKNRVHANFEVVGYLVEELRDESTYRTFCKDLEDANVFIGSLIFVEELALKVKAAVEKERERLDAVLVFPSMPEVMRLNKLGSFSMSQLGQSKSPFFQLFKKKKQSAGFADSMLKLVRTLPKVLKYLPSDKAQDARLYILSLQFWLGGSPDNLQNFLKMISGSYVPALKGAKIEYSDPVLYLDSGIWHPLAPCMYDDVKEYLNWYGTRSDANEKLSACLGPHFWKPGFWKTPRFWMLVFGHQVWENTRLGFPKHPFLLPYTPFSQHPVSVTRFLSLSLVSFPRLSSSLPFLSRPFARIPSAAFLPSESSYNLHNNVRFTSMEKPANSFTSHSASSSSPCSPVLQKSIALAASISLLMWPTPANAGFLSGFSGIESVPGPQLPQIDFLNRFNEENQKKYAEADARFKSSPLLKELLERSKLNKEKNRQKIVDKYCIRGAEWGVGDCSAEGMSPEERENFISMLKRKAGVD